jgi:hypothetical protein
MSSRSYRVSNMLIWTCVASCDEFCMFEKLYVETFHILPWFMHCQHEGEVCAWFGHLGTNERCPKWFGSFRGNFLQGSHMGQSNLPGGGHMTRGGLTGLCRWFNCPMLCELGLLFVMHFQETFLHGLVQWELAYVQGELLCEFLARGLVCLWCYLLFAWACFV